MIRFLKLVMLPIVLLPVAIFFAKRDVDSALNLGFDGEVIAINWKSRNHGLPLIEVRDFSNSKVIVFSHYKITLREGDLNIGDKISKVKGEKQCHVNGIPLKCIK